MSKINYTSSLKKRLEAAKANKSILAATLLTALNKSRESQLGDSRIDYIDTRIARDEWKTIYRICISYCSKDDNNENNPTHGNPQFPWLKENRSTMDIGAFALKFKDVKEKYDAMSAEQRDYELKLLTGATMVGSKVTYRIGTTKNDFQTAYLQTNYIQSKDAVSSLHGSCMRYDDEQRTNLNTIIGNFYSIFAGAKIIIAETASGEVCGRAILWDNVSVDRSDADDIRKGDKISFLDRIYYTHEFIFKGIREFAESKGIGYYKKVNDFSHKTKFVKFETGECVDMIVETKIPANKWHPFGAPYMDTMSFIGIGEDGKSLVLKNERAGNLVTLEGTGGYGSRVNHICPICGQVHRSEGLCSDCMQKYMTLSGLPLYEYSMFNNSVVIDGKIYPKEATKNGKLGQYILIEQSLCRICTNY